jgi:hypothetical protein
MFASAVPRFAKMLGVSEGLIWLCTVLAVIALVVAGASSGGPLAMFVVTFVVPLGLASAFQRRRDERESG